jgi:hypothetical protein
MVAGIVKKLFAKLKQKIKTNNNSRSILFFEMLLYGAKYNGARNVYVVNL